MTTRWQRFNDFKDVLNCECEPQDSLVLRVRNTFYEWPQFPLRPPLRRSSSGPPAAKEPLTSRHSIASIQKVIGRPLQVQTVDQAWQPGPAQACHAAESEPLDAFDQYGLHPSHALWSGQLKIMLRNIPSRCKDCELRNFIVGLGIPSDMWSMNMPVSASGRNRGYAFVTAINSATATEIVNILWKRSIPTRASERPLKLQPAECQLERRGNVGS